MLDEILASVRRGLPETIAAVTDNQIRARSHSPRDFIKSLSQPGLAVIAEFKRRSPSKGMINDAIDPADQARIYERGGASAISVLTEPEFFSGSGDDLHRAREAVGIPVLRKDFIVHPAQVWEAASMGADALLLIVAALSDQVLSQLLAETRTAGLAALVEVHSREEAKRAIQAGAATIGVNNRNLATFEVDLATAEAIAPLLIGAQLKVAESGIFCGSDAKRMADAGYDAVLVGESLVRSSDPADLLAELLGSTP